MWVFTKHGFLSIVQDRERRDYLVVRGRIEGDIEHCFPGYKATRTDERDYLYRATIPKKTVADWMRRSITEIDYGNFKESVADSRRHTTYAQVWSIMEHLQEALKERQ